jgi:hypothetical protein
MPLDAPVTMTVLLLLLVAVLMFNSSIKYVIAQCCCVRHSNLDYCVQRVVCAPDVMNYTYVD